MAKRYTDAFRRDAVRITTTGGLTRPRLSSDFFGGGAIEAEQMGPIASTR